MNKFIYPTVKNLTIIFLLAQIPIIFVVINKPGFLWLSLELIYLGLIIMWPLMPVSDMDERELMVHLKWKSRLCDAMGVSLILPMLLLSVNPEVRGWDVFRSFSVPMFISFVVCSAFLKKEVGKFFAH